MKYKGYEGSVEYSTHDGCFYGKIENIGDLVNYEGQTLEELKNSFHEGVDDFGKTDKGLEGVFRNVAKDGNRSFGEEHGNRLSETRLHRRTA